MSFDARVPSPEMTQNILEVVQKDMDSSLNKIADVLIEKKVAEYREELQNSKYEIVAEFMNNLEVQTENSMLDGRINVNILIRPNVIRRG